MTTTRSVFAKRLFVGFFALMLVNLVLLPARAATPPTCHGDNVLDMLAEERPDAFARITAKAAATPNAQALLWKIEKDGVAPSYLLGTMHVTDERITELPAETQTLLDQAKTLAVEIKDLTPANAAAAMSKLGPLLVVTPETRFDDLLTAEEKQQLIEGLAKAGVPEVAAMNLQPWLTATLLSVSACEAARESAGLPPLDMKIEASAEAKGIPVVGLETVEEQFRSMAGIARDAQIANLKLALKWRNQVEDFNETLISVYLQRRIAEMFPLIEELIGDPALARLALDDFQTRLIKERNVRMRDRMLPLLGKGGAFVAVGALHLIDRDGLVELLRTAGYKLRPVN